MQMSKRVTKTKHTVRPVTKPAGKKTRFDKPSKVKRRQRRETFTDLSQLKDKIEEQEMRMGGTSVNAAKIMKAVTNEPIVKDLPPLADIHDPKVEAKLKENAQILDEAFDGVDHEFLNASREAIANGTPLAEDVTVEEAVIEEVESEEPAGYKVGLFGALRLGLRDTIVGQIVTAAMGR